MKHDRKKFAVTFTLEADAPFEVWEDRGDSGAWVEADRLTCKAVAGHVKDLEWSGGCQHPAFALFSDRKIKVANVKVIPAEDDGWQPIASAMRDGRRLMLGWWEIATYRQAVGRWVGDVNGSPGWIEEASLSGYPVELEPEFWRELFPAPARPKAKRKTT